MTRLTTKMKVIGAAVGFVLGLCIPLESNAAPKYKLLANFTGTGGSGPYGGVVIDKEGNLYGTTAGGGTGSCTGGCGIVFELTPGKDGAWIESELHTFENDGRDGEDPYSGLILDTEGNVYGTTSSGGTHFSGVVFELTHHGAGIWDETVLYNFCARQNCNDGGSPTAGLVMDHAGNLYGAAHDVFELSRGSGHWEEKVLHRFCSWPNCRDGSGAGSTPILDATGNLYATAEEGGRNCSSCGVVLELTPASGGRWKELVLHAFDNNGKDGYTPGNGAALIMDGSGNLYGTTETGGCCGGIVFKLTPVSNGHWKETILYNFKPGANGSFPTAGVIMDKAGNLYGTTADGGSTSCGCGVIYKLAPTKNGKWTYSVLHRFSGADGAFPAGSLMLDDKGNIYGGTVLGGSTDNGVIFELTP
jgi:uncharacterized repeat protein (TIGR03803 family)